MLWFLGLLFNFGNGGDGGYVGGGRCGDDDDGDDNNSRICGIDYMEWFLSFI